MSKEVVCIIMKSWEDNKVGPKKQIFLNSDLNSCVDILLDFCLGNELIGITVECCLECCTNIRQEHQ